MGPSPVTDVFMERGHLDTETLTQGECQAKIKASNGVVLLQAKNAKLPANYQKLEECYTTVFFLHIPQKEATIPTFDLRLSASLLIDDKLWLFKSPSL